MSREDIVAIACRLFAAFLLITTFRFVATAFPSAIPGDNGWGSLLMLFSFTAVPALAVSALLWWFPLTVANRILPVLREPRPPVTANASEVRELAFALLGLWVLASAIPDAFYWVAYLIFAHDLGAELSDADPDQRAKMIATVAELVVGVWLLLGSRGLALALQRYRYGSEKEESP